MTTYPLIVTGYVDVNSVSLYYEATGEGYPLVLLHMGDLDCRMWDDQFEVFGLSHRTVRYDARGYGQTVSNNDVPFRHTDDLYALMQFLGLEKANILGLSNGAKIAIDFALQYPHSTAKLVLVSPGLDGYEFTSDIFQQYSIAFNEAFEQDNLSLAVEIGLQMWVDGPKRSSAEVNPVVRQKVKSMFFHAYQMPEPADPEPFAVPAIDKLTEIQAPTLIITGEQDIPDTLAIAELLERNISGAKRIRISHAGHVVNMEESEFFNQSVLNFLA